MDALAYDLVIRVCALRVADVLFFDIFTCGVLVGGYFRIPCQTIEAQVKGPVLEDSYLAPAAELIFKLECREAYDRPHEIENTKR